MPRHAQPPDFRYVWLMPGPGSAGFSLAAGSIGLAGVGLGLAHPSLAPFALGMTLAGGAVAALGMVQGARRPSVEAGAREVCMAIVPWGILVTPDSDLRILRWPAVRKISVDAIHSMRGGTPAVVSSVVVIHTDHEILAGRAQGAVGLERLLANLEAYTDEASRWVAADLEGNVPLGDGMTEPVAALLLRHAADLCSTSRGATSLCLPAGGYRTSSARAPSPETLQLLRAVLDAPACSAYDPRPLGAMVAMLLEARELVPELLRLVNAPHPLVAAMAKAAALRLNAPPNRAGSIEEVAPFLFDEDAHMIARWADPSEPVLG